MLQNVRELHIADSVGRIKAGTCGIVTGLPQKMCPPVPDPATSAGSFLHQRGRFAAPHAEHGEVLQGDAEE